MTVVVRMFARAKDLAGADEVTLELPEGSRVADVRRELGRRCPSLGSLLQRSALAVDGDFATDDDLVVTPAAEVALLPPVSGG